MSFVLFLSTLFFFFSIVLCAVSFLVRMPTCSCSCCCADDCDEDDDCPDDECDEDCEGEVVASGSEEDASTVTCDKES